MNMLDALRQAERTRPLPRDDSERQARLAADAKFVKLRDKLVAAQTPAQRTVRAPDAPPPPKPVPPRPVLSVAGYLAGIAPPAQRDPAKDAVDEWRAANAAS